MVCNVLIIINKYGLIGEVSLTTSEYGTVERNASYTETCSYKAPPKWSSNTLLGQKYA